MKLELSFMPESSRHAGALGVNCPPVLHDRLKEIPGYRWSTLDKMPTLPAAWPAVLALGSLVNDVHASLVPDEQVLAWYKRNAAQWKELRTKAVDLGENLVKAEGLSYYPHQIAGAEWLLSGGDLKGRGLLDETGAGKTLTLIAGIDQGRLWEQGPILITCPESVMEHGWFHPLQTFLPDLRVVQVKGTPVKRKKILQEAIDGQWDVLIMGYSNLRTSTRLEAFPGHALKRCIKCGGPQLTMGTYDRTTGLVIPPLDEDGVPVKTINQLTSKEIKEVTPATCQTHIKELNMIPWSLIVSDECHHAMNAHSQTTQALWGVAHYGPTNPRRWAATGTIISTHVDQAWPILHFMDPVAWPVKSKWVSWYCDAGMNYAGFFEVRGLLDKRKDEFHQTFSACTRRVLKAQVLKHLPPKLRGGSLERHLNMSGEQLRVYNDMKDELLSMVDEGLIMARNPMVQVMRLSMMASGTGYPIGTDGEMGIKAPSVKLDALLADWKAGEWEGEQVGVVFSSRKALRMVESALYEHKLVHPDKISILAGDVQQRTRDHTMAQFQEGKRNVCLLTYAAGGEGVTLTAASTVIVFERHWSPIKNSQGSDRFHRIGSERHKAIVYRDYIVDNSNEIRQLSQLSDRAETMESMVKDRDKLRALITG